MVDASLHYLEYPRLYGIHGFLATTDSAAGSVHAFWGLGLSFGASGLWGLVFEVLGLGLRCFDV